MANRWILIVLFFFFYLTGCETLRFAPSLEQKQNAWLHNRTAQLAADAARNEQVSKKIQQLTALCEIQSRAFCSDYGLPDEFPQADSADDVLSQSTWQLADTALVQSAQRPDVFDMADSFFELGIGIAGLIGGVYGVKGVRFLKEARDKSKALREVIEGNELFKRRHTDSAEAFKQAHKGQSTQTRRLVTEIKTS